MMCIGNRVKFAFMLDNFDNVSCNEEIMILSNNFIRPFEKRSYYAVRPSIRPSFPDCFFFNMLWDINFKLGIYIQ